MSENVYTSNCVTGVVRCEELTNRSDINQSLPIVYPSHSQSQWILEQLMSENVDTSNCVLCVLSHQELADTSDTNHTANRDGYKSS